MPSGHTPELTVNLLAPLKERDKWLAKQREARQQKRAYLAVLSTLVDRPVDVTGFTTSAHFQTKDEGDGGIRVGIPTHAHDEPPEEWTPVSFAGHKLLQVDERGVLISAVPAENMAARAAQGRLAIQAFMFRHGDILELSETEPAENTDDR